MVTVGVEKLKDLAAGDTVRARYRLKDPAYQSAPAGTPIGTVEICGTVVDDVATQWFYIQSVPDRVALRQMETPLIHDALVEVVSVTKPPYAEGADSHEPKSGDVVAGPWRSEIGGHPRWMYVRMLGWFPYDDTLGDITSTVYERRQDLPATLRLVRCLQDWPVIDRKWDSDEEFAEQFATAQRMMAKRIRDLPPPGGLPTVQWRDRAAYVVEHFDLDDAYPGDD